jgi:ABC-type phosphate/phosphonate transport system ATPase subunit
MAYIKKKERAKTIEILERVGLELSILIDIHMNFGGQRQRIGIARLLHYSLN